MGGMERIKGEMSERQSHKAEKHHQHSLDLGGSDAEKVRFFTKSALCRSSEFVPALGGEHIFTKIIKRVTEK